jgi:hypothetical protein
MGGTIILLVFFSMFTAAPVLVPLPTFLGNAFYTLFTGVMEQNAQYSSAVLNGVFYGVIFWLVFVAMSR